MSKKKPANVYEILPPGGEAFYVIARHAKGAMTIAREHDGRVKPSTPVRVVHAANAVRAVNRKGA